MRGAIALGVLVMLAASRASAQTEEVTVRGDPTGDFASRADERDSAREVTDAASLVEPLPGVHVRRYGGDDSFSTLSIRGSTSSEVAIVFAGVPLTGGADPSLDLSSLPLWPGAVAHVHRTFAPAALGPGSLGGTLVLDPPKPTTAPVTDVWAAAGSYGEARLRVGDVRDVGTGARLVTAVSASRADDDFSYLNPLASSPGDEVFSTRQNAGHAAVDGLVAWATPLRASGTEVGVLTVTTLAQARHQGLPGTILGPTPFAELDSNRELASAELTRAAGPGTWSARAWGKREGSSLSDVPGSDALGPTRADETIVATGGSAGWRGRPLPSTTIEARVDGSGERFAPGLTVGDPEPPTATRASVGAALDAEWRSPDRLAFALSGRLDRWTDGSDGSAVDHLQPTAHVGTELRLFDGASLAAHGGATARPPSFVELYGDRGAFVGDPSLLPESAWAADAGVRASRRLGPVKVSTEIVGFGTWATDLIAFVPIGAYGRAEATNIGSARLLGVEVDLRATAGPIALRAAYTGLATEDDSACEAVVGPCVHPPLPGRPADDLVADVIGTAGPASLRLGVDAVSGIVDDLAGSIGVPPRVLASAGARADVLPGVRVALDVRNAFDVRTGTYVGALGPVVEPIGDLYEYPLPGRTFLVSVRFRRPAEER